MAKIEGLSLFQKTGLLAVCLFGVISIVASAFTAWVLHERMTEEFLSKGTAIARSIAGASQEILLNRDAATVQAMIDQYLDFEGVAYVYVMDGDMQVISHTFVPEIPAELIGMHASKKGRRVDEVRVASHGRVIDICEPILAGVAGYVHVGMDRELISEYFWSAVLRMQLLMAAILAVAVAVLHFVTLRISKPLLELTKYAQRLAAHDFDARIHIGSRDEVGILGRSMQSMGSELARLVADLEGEVDKATGELRENTVYLSAIIDNLADGLLVVSPSGAVTVINPAMLDFFDLGDASCVGFAAADVLPKELVDMTAEIRKCGQGAVEAELPLSRGRIGLAVGNCITVENDSSGCLGGVALVRDVTRERELDQLKTDFISTVSHELRTPMTSVLGFAKIIRKKLDQTVLPALGEGTGARRSAAQVEENVEIIVTEAERLTELINDVLDIAKMEAGDAMWRDRDVDMRDVVRQSADSTRGLWNQRDVALEVELESGPMVVWGDPNRLVQVMVNLISNAVKFTRDGPVVCRARREGDRVTVSVADRGPGVPEFAREDIFDKFKQVGDTLTDKPSGTGLGLPICRRIVERHGGRIWVEGRPGGGSVFTFSLPRASAVESKDEAVCSRHLPDRDVVMLIPDDDGPVRTRPLILVVDDDPVHVRYLTHVLEENGFLAAAASGGEAALEKARGLLPDLVVTDIMMPDVDGRTVIRCLRADPFLRHVPVLALSALNDGFSAGGDMALTKPVDEARLLEVIRSLLQRSRSLVPDCLAGGDAGAVDGLGAIVSENVTFCPVGEVERRVQDGFTGVVLASVDVAQSIDLEKLTRNTGASVALLPDEAEENG